MLNLLIPILEAPAMGKAELREALVKRTGWSKQALSARVKRLRQGLPMDTATAQAVLAHQAGIRLDRHLDPAGVAEVQRVLPLLNVATQQPAERARAEDRVQGPRRPSQRREIVFADQFEYEDRILPEERLREARDMASIYPMLYVLENSMRELVKLVMVEKHGADWWETSLTTGRAKSAKVKADDRHRGEDNRRWHQRRGAHPIDYTDLSDLGDIILAKRVDFFPDVFGGGDSLEWFMQFMRELEPSRNVVSHMNPLDEHNALAIRLSLSKWQKVISHWRGESGAVDGPA